MTTIKERIAGAIVRLEGSGPDMAQYCMRDAEAALTELLNPADEMIEAMVACEPVVHGDWNLAPREEMKQRFTAAIQKALDG